MHLLVVIFMTSMVSYISATSPHVEPGFLVRTAVDLRKLAINVHSLNPDPDGAFLLGLDSTGSRILRLQLPLSQNGTVELFAGSYTGETGYVDGPATKALFNHPRSFVVDEKGDVYVGDTRNFAVRKISNGQVTTIAGGKLQKAGYADGPGEDACFSADINLAYVRGSLLISDIGNGLIREIQLRPSSPAGFRGTHGAMLLIPLAVLLICVLGFFIRQKIILPSRKLETSHFLLMMKNYCMKIQQFVIRSEAAEAAIHTFVLVYSLIRCCILCFIPSMKTSSKRKPRIKPRPSPENVIMQQLESLFQQPEASLPDLISFDD